VYNELLRELGRRDSSVGIETMSSMIGFVFPPEAGNSYLRFHVQIGSDAHAASYPVGTGFSFPWNKVADV
jgi:hypothetical protein